MWRPMTARGNEHTPLLPQQPRPSIGSCVLDELEALRARNPNRRAGCSEDFSVWCMCPLDWILTTVGDEPTENSACANAVSYACCVCAHGAHYRESCAACVDASREVAAGCGYTICGLLMIPPWWLLSIMAIAGCLSCPSLDKLRLLSDESPPPYDNN